MTSPEQTGAESGSQSTKSIYGAVRFLGVVGTVMVAMHVAIDSRDTPQQGDPRPVDMPNEPTEVYVPAALPKQIARRVPSAVKVMYGEFDGSGVKVGRNLVVSAGHMVVKHPRAFRSYSDKPIKPSDWCPSAYTLNKHEQPWESDQITNWTARYGGAYSWGSDMALFRIAPNKSFTKVPIAPVATREPHKGSTVFFVNYETTASGKNEHYPNKPLARYYEGSRQRTLLTRPAEFGGVVLGHRGGLLIVATGIKAYGPRATAEKNLHNGGSGGPVFDRAGRVIGVSVASEDARYNHTYAQEDLRYSGIKIRNNLAGLQAAYVQPITTATLHRYKESLSEHPHC